MAPSGLALRARLRAQPSPPTTLRAVPGGSGRGRSLTGRAHPQGDVPQEALEGLLNATALLEPLGTTPNS